LFVTVPLTPTPTLFPYTTLFRSVVSSGSLNVNGQAALPTLTLAGGTVGGTGAVTVVGSFDVTVSNSALSGAGVLTTQGVSTVNKIGMADVWTAVRYRSRMTQSAL